MLEELKVLNGNLTPKYDKYNNQYTITIHNDISKIDFEFVKDDDVEIEIFGNNNLKVGTNNIVLVLKQNDQKEYIYINAIKEQDEEVTKIFDNGTELELVNSKPVYAGFLISFSCFLILFLVFLLLFKRKRRS